VVATIGLLLLVFAVTVAHIIDRGELRAAKPVPEGFADQHFNQRRDVDTETGNHCYTLCSSLDFSSSEGIALAVLLTTCLILGTHRLWINLVDTPLNLRLLPFFLVRGLINTQP